MQLHAGQFCQRSEPAFTFIFMMATHVDDASSRANAAIVENELRAAAIQALTSCGDGLELDKNVFLAALSADDHRKLSIHPEEEKIISPKACSRKKNEFALGRAAVRCTLREFGQDYVSVLRGDHGEPLWPDEIQGSITHCWPWSVALVARSRRLFAIGIDMESLEKVRRADISPVVCTPGELGWVRDAFSSDQRLAMIFSAKEAVYKGLFRFCRQYIDFKDVELAWVPEQQSFLVSLLERTKTQLPALRGCQVHCRCFDGVVFSCMVYEAAVGLA